MPLEYEEWQDVMQQGATDLGLVLHPSQIKCFYGHMCEMRHWNRRINLTAITNPVDIAVKHFLDSIALSGLVPDQAAILDIGSGAGFPGLPLKVLRPLSHVTLVDSARKRINFLRHVTRQLGLDQVDPVQARIEEFFKADAAGKFFDIIVSRAFTRAADLARTVAPLLINGGKLLLWKGFDIDDELRDLEMLPESLEVDLAIEIHPYRLPLADVGRNLISIEMA